MGITRFYMYRKKRSCKYVSRKAIIIKEGNLINGGLSGSAESIDDTHCDQTNDGFDPVIACDGNTH